MSAFVVSDNHINYIVRFFQKSMDSIVVNGYVYKSDDIDDLDLMAQTLHNENCKSWNYRYHEKEPADDVKYDQFKFPSIDTLQVVKACDCLEYQSCEHPDYYKSSAYKIMAAIRGTAICKLPGYGELKWEIA